jgi:hypothetical protein
MTHPPRPAKPPTWLAALAILSVPVWLLGMYWLNNSYSGWNTLAAIHHAADHDLTNSVGPTAVTVIQPSGRKFEYVSRRGHKQAEAGFDDTGFWVRAMGSGWFSGPGTPIFVPWDAVESCGGLRVQLRHPRFALVIHDQDILDACNRHVGRTTPSPCD